jgi:hypothetical protein
MKEWGFSWLDYFCLLYQRQQAVDPAKSAASESDATLIEDKPSSILTPTNPMDEIELDKEQVCFGRFSQNAFFQ